MDVYEEKQILNKIFDYCKDKTLIYISHKKEIISMFKEKYKISVNKILGNTKTIYSHHTVACLNPKYRIRHAIKGIRKQRISIILEFDNFVHIISYTLPIAF